MTDIRTRAIDAIIEAYGLLDATFSAVTPQEAVDALVAAGVLGPLDELAAWADEHDRAIHVERDPHENKRWRWSVSVPASGSRDGIGAEGASAAEAARRVLDQTTSRRADT